MSRERDTLADALRAAADAVEAAVRKARSAHGQYVRLIDAERSWSRLDDTIGEQIRRRRTDVGLTGATDLVQSLLHEAEHVAARYPDVDSQGRHLPPRPPSDDPDAVREWWQGLSEHQRDEVLRSQTAWAGRADGLPARVRHVANLRLLDAEIERRGGAAAAEAGAAPIHDAASLEEIRDLRGLLKLHAFLHGPGPDAHQPDSHPSDPQRRPDPRRPGEHRPDIRRSEPHGPDPYAGTPLAERSCYLLDASAYPLKAAILLGDLDTASTVILHVPGTTTTVDLRLEREVAWMSALRAEAGRLAGGREHVAIIDWIGYHAPYDVATRRALGDSGVRVLVPGEASDERYARAAAPDLVRCARGLRAILPARPSGRIRLVASGHSYGASVMGLALAETDAFDAAVVAGCPGLFATSAAQLRLPPDSLYAAVAPGDIIGFLGIFGGQVLTMEGVRILSPFPRLMTYPGGRRVLLRQIWGHESYYSPGSTTLLGIAAAAVGVREAIRTVSGRWALTNWNRRASTARDTAAPTFAHNEDHMGHS